MRGMYMRTTNSEAVAVEGVLPAFTHGQGDRKTIEKDGKFRRRFRLGRGREIHKTIGANTCEAFGTTACCTGYSYRKPNHFFLNFKSGGEKEFLPSASSTQNQDNTSVYDTQKVS